MEKFKGKYRIQSARAPFWDYGWNAAYFVTILTKNRELVFGEVVNREMVLSGIGGIAHRCWLEIPQHFPFVELDVFVVMPNHVHGIVVINKPGGNVGGTVETQNFASQPQRPRNQFGPQSKNLASIIRGFKIGVTKNARITNPEFEWQPLYHDHIIRDDGSYQRISDYIIDNPASWTEDKFYSQ